MGYFFANSLIENQIRLFQQIRLLDFSHLILIFFILMIQSPPISLSEIWRSVCRCSWTQDDGTPMATLSSWTSGSSIGKIASSCPAFVGSHAPEKFHKSEIANLEWNAQNLDGNTQNLEGNTQNFYGNTQNLDGRTQILKTNLIAEKEMGVWTSKLGETFNEGGHRPYVKK